MNAEFLDTNVLVYAVDRSAGPKHEKAVALVDRLWDAGTGCVSIQVLQEFFVVVTRKIPNPMPTGKARSLVSDYGRWRVHRPSVEDLTAAIDLAGSSRLSFWDAMIVRSASESEASVLWSEDLHAGSVIGGVRILDPFTDPHAAGGFPG